jgi:hypothetical protein
MPTVSTGKLIAALSIALGLSKHEENNKTVQERSVSVEWTLWVNKGGTAGIISRPLMGRGFF